MTDHPGVTGRKSGSLTGRRGKTSSADIAAAKSEFDRTFDVDTGADIAGDDAPSSLSLIKIATEGSGAAEINCGTRRLHSGRVLTGVTLSAAGRTTTSGRPTKARRKPAP